MKDIAANLLILALLPLILIGMAGAVVFIGISIGFKTGAEWMLATALFQKGKE